MRYCVDVNITKTCQKCKRDLPITAFHKHAKRFDSLQASCKECRALYIQEHKVQIYAKRAEHRQKNPEKIKAQKKAYYWAHRNEIIAKNAEYRQPRREELCAKQKKRRKANPEEYKARDAAFHLKRPEYSAQYYTLNKERISAYSKKRTDALPNSVVINRLTNHNTLSPADIPEEFIKLKRAQLQLARKLKGLKK